MSTHKHTPSTPWHSVHTMTLRPYHHSQAVCEIYATNDTLTCSSHVLLSLVLYKLVDPDIEVRSRCPFSHLLRPWGHTRFTHMFILPPPAPHLIQVREDALHLLHVLRYRHWGPPSGGAMGDSGLHPLRPGTPPPAATSGGGDWLRSQIQTRGRSPPGAGSVAGSAGGGGGSSQQALGDLTLSSVVHTPLSTPPVVLVGNLQDAYHSFQLSISLDFAQ